MLCNLVQGSGVFVIGGILTRVAQDLQVSVAAAGQAMTAYAVSTALLSPLLPVLTGRWPRRRAMLFGLLLFAIGSLASAFAPSLGWLLAGRALMGMGAITTPISGGAAVALVAPAQRGRALSLVFLGISLSYVIGTPLGAWLGFAFGWRWPVGLVAVASLLAALAVWRLMPKQLNAPGASFAGLPRLLAQGAVAWTLSLTLLYFVAIFMVFSFIGPVLQALVPMSAERLSFTLMAFGLAGVVGTLLGGWLNDRFGALRVLPVQLTVLVAMMLAVPLTQGQYLSMLAVVVVWGLAGFGMMAPQQSRLAALAPAHAPMLLSLNSSMLYLGTAAGAAIGGGVVGSVGLARLSWVGVPFALAGLGTLWLGRRRPQAPAPH